METKNPQISQDLALLTKAVFDLNGTQQTTEKAGARHTSKEFKALNRIIQVALELGAELPQAEPGFDTDDPERRRLRRQLIQNAWSTKAGAKHSRGDVGLIQELHDLSVGMGGMCKVKGPYAGKTDVTKGQNDASNIGINHSAPTLEVDIGKIEKNRENSTADQVKARDAVNNAIKAGKLPHAKTLKCYRCKASQADQYHHPRGWSKGFILTVRPICSKCHRVLTPNGKADITKGQNDAPNYRSANSPEACTNCRFFSKKVGNQFCSLFNFMFADNYVCDSWETMEPSLIPGFKGQADVIQAMGLVEMSAAILALRGAGGSGNWGHAGRPGKLGGSGGGGGLKRIGVKPGSSVGARKKAAKKFQAKDKKQTAKPKLQAKPKAAPKPAAKKKPATKPPAKKPAAAKKPAQEKEAKPKGASSKLDDIFDKAPKGSEKNFTNHLMNKMVNGEITLKEAQSLNARFAGTGEASAAKPPAKKKPTKPGAKKEAAKPKPQPKSKGTTTTGDVKNPQTTNHEEMSDAYDGWHKGMSKAENAGLRRYQGNDYIDINNHLRFGDETDAENRTAIRNIDKALKKSSVPKNTTVFRGMDVDVLEDLLGDNPSEWTGRDYSDKGYMSTTVDKKQAFPGVKMEIRVPKGARGGYLGNLPDGTRNRERELLLGRGQKLRIVKVQMGGLFSNNGVKKVIAEIVSE